MICYIARSVSVQMKWEEDTDGAGFGCKGQVQKDLTTNVKYVKDSG